MFHFKDLQDVFLSGKQEQNMDSSQYAICVNILRSTYAYIDICTKGLGGQVIILYYIYYSWSVLSGGLEVGGKRDFISFCAV